MKGDCFVTNILLSYLQSYNRWKHKHPTVYPKRILELEQAIDLLRKRRINDEEHCPPRR